MRGGGAGAQSPGGRGDGPGQPIVVKNVNEVVHDKTVLIYSFITEGTIWVEDRHKGGSTCGFATQSQFVI